jgi:hypothetical protein
MRRILLSIAAGVLALGGLALIAPAAVRADDPPNMQDPNTFWRVAEDPTAPDPRLDPNTYWAEVQAKQIWQSMQQPQPPQ